MASVSVDGQDGERPALSAGYEHGCVASEVTRGRRWEEEEVEVVVVIMMAVCGCCQYKTGLTSVHSGWRGLRAKSFPTTPTPFTLTQCQVGCAPPAQSQVIAQNVSVASPTGPTFSAWMSRLEELRHSSKNHSRAEQRELHSLSTLLSVVVPLLREPERPVRSERRAHCTRGMSSPNANLSATRRGHFGLCWEEVGD